MTPSRSGYEAEEIFGEEEAGEGIVLEGSNWSLL